MTPPSETPPAVERIEYDFIKQGAWLQWHPVQGPSVSIFIPNKWLAPLSRIFSGRVGMLLDDGSAQRAPEDKAKEG